MHTCHVLLRLRGFAATVAAAWATLVFGLVVPTHGALALGCSGELSEQGMVIGGDQPDLVVNQPCKVLGGTYYFRHVNIIAPAGKLIFIEPAAESQLKGQDFWATSIIIENGGAILAGVDDAKTGVVGVAPYGTNKKTLTFHLYGSDPRGNDVMKSEGPGESCVPIADKTLFGDCGIPLKQTIAGQDEEVWNNNGSTAITLPGGVKDYFYQYGNFHGDTGTSPDTGQEGHFGYKVLALSYGGTLQLRGLKGTSGTIDADIKTMLKDADALTPADDKVITSPGTDWVRLTDGGKKTSQKLTVSGSVQGNWQAGDEIVVTTTDYFPEHSELRQIAPPQNGDAANVVRMTKALDYDHASTMYDIGKKVGTDKTAFRTAIEKTDGPDAAGYLDKAETRAAVALLSRSIKIVSEGDKVGDKFAEATDGNATKQIAANPHYMYGGHVAFRQGFERLQIQGVEFKQLGQGGFMGRYPVHFHVARRVPADTYVIDSSVNESMTRWFVIHSTLGVMLARNVGYKSIGHGYFLEDATETDNKLYSNIGIYARAGVESADNPRGIPGILAAPNAPKVLPLKFHSDTDYPTVFWITNAWNSLAGNMAAGAGTCGACYWYLSTGNHDMMDVHPANDSMVPMKWSGYSAIQAAPASDGGPRVATRAGLSPVRLFYKNYCSSAQHSVALTDESVCTQVAGGAVRAISNMMAPPIPEPPDDPDKMEYPKAKAYYPRYSGLRHPTVCDANAADGAPNSCSTARCDFAKTPEFCVPTIFSHYTSSFNFAESNFGAIWMRSSFLLLDHAFLSDVQGPGVTMVTGGDYTRSNLPVGYWGLTTNSIFVGATQPDNVDAAAQGPKDCDRGGNFCLDRASGTAFPVTNWGMGQRLFSIYDGPSYQDANAYLDIHPSKCNSVVDCLYYSQALGVRKAGKDIPGVAAGEGYLPNAAIAWKQPNGFYYPPAFHSRNLFFKDVDIRHYVVEPLTNTGTYISDLGKFHDQYKGNEANTNPFTNFSDIDRQTELNDDDGSLTGFTGTVSVNEDPFFAAPVQTAQCRSGVGVDAGNACSGQTPPNPATARTSPYDHITAVIYPGWAAKGENRQAKWAADCTNEQCTGVPMYRQYLTGTKGKDAASSTREWVTWVGNNCDKLVDRIRDKSRPWVNPTDKVQPYVDPDFIAYDAKCRFPFVRMAAGGTNARAVLTVNNGRYYIDTTRSLDGQTWTPDMDTRSAIRQFSVFEPNETYYVFFVFAKPSIKQTYQIYVGPDFKLDDGGFKGVRMGIDTLPLVPKAVDKPSWATAHMDADNKNMLDVVVDFSLAKDVNLNPKNLSTDETCQPRTYCSKVGSGDTATCTCDEKKLGVLGLLNPNYKNVCNNVCSHWAVEDIDCPKGGCLGFQFTLRGGFKATDQYERPKPLPYPDAISDSTSPWVTTVLRRTATSPDGSANPGGCYYADNQIPNDRGTCKVAE
jgi:cell migration-inducing and hyaluronan-binding protein